MITSAAARSRVRIMRADPSDNQPAIDLTATGSHSVMVSATSTLAYDSMRPQEPAVTELTTVRDEYAPRPGVPGQYATVSPTSRPGATKRDEPRRGWKGGAA
ncbi:hypothetical protein [Rhodococcus sp. OK302]|uniref:hypothetical protein n=1 Tax=Rhodococcus sp. OK302 TaxID=1882769 RepID=UPI000B93EE8E|nr:hypothetical protein [Rhodococcus sp. OK302]